MSQETFAIAYDGEALRTHLMDVRDLAPALLAMGQLFDETNRVLNGEKTQVRLQVKAQQEGSFEIIFELWTQLSSQITGFLSGEYVTSAANLKSLLFDGSVGGFSLFRLVRWLKGGKPDKLTDNKNGTVRIEKDGKSLEVPLDVLRLYQDIAVREAVQEVLKPLSREGIDTFQVKEKSVVVETITKDEVHFYAVPELADEKIKEFEHEAAYSIVSLAFKDDNKWRLYDGNTTISVSIVDEEFLRKVEQNLISFTKHDILFCRVRTTQWRTEAGLRTEYEVLEVVEHRPAARQLNFFD